MQYDVVVAGAGPAGSAAAYDLARFGVKVLLLEGHREIGKPVHCSGLVTPRTLEVAGTGASTVRHQIHGALVYSSVGNVLRLGDGRVRAVVIDRLAFDVLLAERAVANGAELWLSHRLDRIEREGTSLRLTLSTPHGMRIVNTTLLIGADGAGSITARFLGQHTNTDRVRALGALVTLGHGNDPQFVRVFVGQKIAPKWFGWLIPTGDGRARVGVGAPMDLAVSPRDLMTHMMQRFPEEFADARVLQLSAGTIPLYRPIQTYGDNVLLVGDAARQVKPLSGGGIWAALVGARYCAATALEGLAAGNVSARFLRRYQERWHRRLRSEFDTARRLRQLVYRFGDLEHHAILGWLGQPLFQDMIRRHGDIDFPGRLFSRLSGEQTLRHLPFDLHLPAFAPVAEVAQ